MQTLKRNATLGLVLLTALAVTAIAACDSSNGGNEPDEEVGISPFSITLRVQDATVEEVAAALASHIHEVDDSQHGLPADWIVAGGDHLEAGDEAVEAALRMPDGSRVVEVCNHHYASMAMSFGGHHGVALPCEIAIAQRGADVEVILLNPEAIFGVFFMDVPPEAAAEMGGLAATVRSELEDLIEAGLQSFDTEFSGEPMGPVWTEEQMMSFADQTYSIVMDMEIPAAYLGSDDDRQAFRAHFVNELLETLTHEEMESVGSQVAGLSVQDWRSARTHALGLPGGVSIVEVCSPTYATAALGAGAHHAPALPCEIAIWVDGDMLRVHILDPMFIFPVFFGDAPAEMMEQMGGLAAAVQGDLSLIVTAAQDAALAE